MRKVVILKERTYSYKRGKMGFWSSDRCERHTWVQLLGEMTLKNQRKYGQNRRGRLIRSLYLTYDY
jgi:hypothetical protein